MSMKPLEYLKRYSEMTVPLVDSAKRTVSFKVRLNRYVLITGQAADGNIFWDKLHPGNQREFDKLMGALRSHFARKGAWLTVLVHTVNGAITEKAFLNWRDLWYHAKKALLGKGSPEEAQITLQLAVRFRLADALYLQTYCDKYLGLDCNGYVGNFITHGWRGKPWDIGKPGSDFLANKGINTIMTSNGRAIHSLNELDANGLFMMGLADGKIKGSPVIDRFGSVGVGHLLVTEPGIKVVGLSRNKTVPVLRGVESTGGVGLTNANVDLQDVSKDGVFTVKRWSHPEMGPMAFRIFQVT